MVRSLIHQHIGRYYIKELLGRGGMAAVYRAADTVLQRDVALKVLYPHFSDDPAVVERFKREAVTAASLAHPHIVAVYDVGEQDGLVFIAMQLLTGRTLQDRLQETGTLNLEALLEVLAPVAEALDYAHARGVIHRDVKPGNIFLSDAAEGPGVVLADFGIAKQLDMPGLTTTGALIGTPDYMAPEQIAGGQVGPPGDVYALGMLTYRALTGRRAFDGSVQDVLLGHLYGQPAPPSQVNPALPPALDAVLARATARNPADRYQSAGAFVRDLRLVARGAGEATMPGPTPALALAGATLARPAPLPTAPAPGAATVATAGAGSPATQSIQSGPWLTVLAAVLALGGLALTLVWITNGGGSAGGTPPPPLPSASLPLVLGETTTAATSPSTEPPTATVPGIAAPTATTSATSTATASPAPTATPGITPTAASTAPPDPTATPRPTEAPTALPLPSATPIPTEAPTATPRPTETPTATEVAACRDELLAGGFGRLFRENVNVRVGLGCPLVAESAGKGSVQFFEGGTMLYWDLANRTRWRDYIFVFEGLDQGAYQALSPAAVADLGPAPTPGPDPNQPVRGFGRVYFYQPGVRETLGAWLSPEIVLDDATPGVIQFYEQGAMIYTPIYRSAERASIFVLYNTGRFERYNDN
ncbi:MAG: protein kinase [Oscillochloridaceae bacterium]|nr:protein kinase [Chloroflexaceae bacterium]MDW8390871.1 protein kinase [Oscillochloridaceae bacterium]